MTKFSRQYSTKVVWLSLACVGFALPLAAQTTEKVHIRMDVDHVVRTMQGGIGASWHAIETPIWGREADGDPWAGGVWGANPPADDDAAWQQLYRHAAWLGLDWCRVEIEQRMYEPARGQFEWDNSEMRILYRILDWAEKNQVDIFLQQQFSDVEWNAYPALRSNRKGILTSAPYSLEDFAEGFAALADHLVRVKGYHCIQWLCITNEPGMHFSDWQGPDGKPLPLTPGLKATRAALDRKSISVPISGPDWTDLPELDPAQIDFDAYIGAYDIHSYMSMFDGEKYKDAYTLSQAEERISKWAAWAHARHKPLFLSEVGTQTYGWGYSDPNPGSYKSSLKDASLVVRAIRAGVDGVSHWSFINRGDQDGQWQLVDTWDLARNRLLPTFTPHPNSYFMIGLLTRFLAKHSEVLANAVEGGSDSNGQQVFAAALRSPRGQHTFVFVNDAEVGWQADIHLGGLSTGMNLYRYRMTPEKKDKAEVILGPEKEQKVSRQQPDFTEELPAKSITVYSTYHFQQGDPGAIAE
jgi:hypothetical protein